MINQISVEPYLSYFERDLYKQGLKKYEHNYLPTIFYGLGDVNVERIQNNTSIKIMVWTGGDIKRFCQRNDKSWGKSNKTPIEFFNQPDVYNIAISTSISELMRRHGMKHIIFPFAPKYDENKFRLVQEKGENIHFYTSHNPDVYGYNTVVEIEKRLGNKYPIIYTSSQENKDFSHKIKNSLIKQYGLATFQEIDRKIQVFPNEKMPEIYKKCFISLRLSDLDGLSSSVQELGMMGIRTVNNSIGSPSTINYKNIDDITHIIEEEYKTRKSVYDLGVKEYLKIPLLFYTEMFFKFDPNYYFDKIYVINLERDKGKKEAMIRKLQKARITNYQIFPAVDGRRQEIIDVWNKYSKIPYTDVEKRINRKLIASPGVLGNLYSVKNILLDAQKNNYHRILIFEDDVLFKKDFQTKFIEAIEKIEQDWVLLLLGCNEQRKQNFLDKKSKIVNGTYHPDDVSSGGFAFAVSHEIYDDLIRECVKIYSPFDSGPMKFVQKKYPERCHVLFPNLVIADVSSSGLREGRSMSEFCSRNEWDLKTFDR